MTIKEDKKKKGGNFFSKISKNAYLRNVLLMIVIFLALLFIVLVGLNLYTKHNESVSVPAVKGLLFADGAVLLKSAELSYEVVDSIYSDTGIPGSIVEQVPLEKSNVKKGRTIYLTLQAKSKQLIEIPDLKDYSRRQAEAQLNSLGFTKIKIKEVSSIYKGLVISVSCNGKVLTPKQKLPKGSIITLTVGAGGESNPDELDNEVSYGDSKNDNNTFFN